MPVVPNSNRVFAAVFLGLLLLHLVLIATARLYPFTDLPDHLAAATIARHIDEPSNQFNRYYAVNALGKPNTLHLVFCSLTVFPSVEFANRVFMLLYAALLPLATLAVITRLGGNRWFSLLSFVLLYNCSVSWGFIGFAFAVPLVLIFYYLFILDRRALESVSGALFAAAFLLLIFFTHLLAALFCILVLCLALLFRGAASRRAALGGLLATIPLLALTALWWRGETRDAAAPGTLPFLSNYYGTVYLQSFAARRGIFVFDNYHLQAGARGYALALVFSLAIIVPPALFLLRRRAARSLATELAPALPLFLGSLLSVLVLPTEIPQQTVLYERFSVLLLLSLIMCGSILAPRTPPRLLPVAFTALAAAHLVLWSEYFISFNRENSGFDKSFLEPAGRAETLAGFIYDYTYRGRPTYIHFPSYYIVWEQSVATAMITDYRFGPVRRNVDRRLLPRYLEWVARLGNYDGRYRDMDYLLVRGSVQGAAASRSGAPEVPAEYLEGFQPVRANGAWSLYRRAAPRP